jgi:glyoxylase-like metal-dependent hydrolase (beta-lactamase superfamily II)
VELEPGLRAIRVGGHTAGQQILVVDTATGPVLLTSDAVHFYEEYERARPFAVLHDLEACYRAYDTIRTLTDTLPATLVAGHDPAVADRFGPVSGAGRAFALQIA